jgi:hypothetical protein
VAGLRSLRKRAKAVSTYIAERREADRFQPEGWETAEGRALLSQYRAEITGKTPAADLTGETTVPLPETTVPLPGTTGRLPAGRGVARVPPSTEVVRRSSMEVSRHPSAAVARHSSEEVAAETYHRPRHDGTQPEVEPSYLLSRPPATRHGTPAAAETCRVLTITNIVRGPDGDPLAGAIVTISLIADSTVPGLQPNAIIDGVARIVTAEEGGWNVEETAGSQVVPVNTHYQVAEGTGQWPAA